MRKKWIISLAAVGLLASSLSVGAVKAEGNEYELSKKRIESQIEKPINKGIIDSRTFNQLEKEVKGSQSYLTNSLNKMGVMNSAAASDEEYLLEMEYNDTFNTANATSYNKPTIGQLLPLYDVDFHKVVVPQNGLLMVAGGTNSYAIDLAFAAMQKDFVENDKLVYLGSEYEEGIEYQVYQAKGGTYYVGVIDNDNDYFDDNTEEDLYVLATAFADNVAPNKPTVNKVDNNDKVVTGKGESGATITVKNGNTVVGSAKAASNGNFTVNMAVQKAGAKLTITAKDKAGNVSASVSVTVVDGTAPSKPAVNKVDNNDKVVTGKAEANSSVTVKRGDALLGTTKAAANGSFSVSIPVQGAGAKLTVTAKDSAGNVSPSASVTVADVIAPTKPTVNKVDSNDKVVTGKAEYNSTITIKNGKTVLATGKTPKSGSFSIAIPVQKVGVKLTATAKDGAGNVSSATTVTVVKH
ncbi:Ig-like domain-containing protein [Metabacillus idriensis]|uniref:Ig-like domain-containing protein n=1 Tax=Metabacillus idriensis TaxID=324768 RepID=UPI0028148CA4|nr:Ig-like domain-containing protein [Metabacillus idriensis]MDR0136776.1 Ig-like domain-containing protein [Metabacillus idriensis]